ncbi:MAG: hypothetical protein ACSHWZ_04375 [Sulfitobacter sp.]
MNKVAIAVVALPLGCMGAGYAAGMALSPAMGESQTMAAEGEAAAHAVPEPSLGQDGKHAAAEGPILDQHALADDRMVIRLGQMTVPVEKPHSVSYVVADFALKLESLELAEQYKRVEEATRIRDSLLTAMNLAAESAVLRGAAIDSDALSSLIRDLLRKDYAGIDDVMFISLYKQDVARL